ncbi:hypothetical protein LTR17_010148 [Elasticomyces elasticus]|nr:hypothetical protein LTR17_010148 [Elasticomyces elasticus]
MVGSIETGRHGQNKIVWHVTQNIYAMADTTALDSLLTTTLARLQEFATFLSPTAASPLTQPIDEPPNPLHVLRDAALLVKAHTTKLSLLAINKPFTPSAIAKVLRQLSAEALPALMSAVQICQQERSTYGTMMAAEAQARVRRVFREMESLLQEIQSLAQGETWSKSTLTSTGVVWEACDALILLEKLGVGGLAVQKAEQWRDTIKDAIEELREWAAGEDEENEGFDSLLDENDEGVEGDRDSVEDLFNAANSLPKDRPELKALVEEADGRLKKVVLLYTALLKRRLKTFDAGTKELAKEGREQGVRRIDEAMENLQRIPHQIDELAACLYDLDEAKSKAALEKCVKEAVAASTVMADSWNGQADEFTAWSVKWRAAVEGM